MIRKDEIGLLIMNADRISINNPKVSIIVPTYNRCKLIMETIDSVVAQTFANWECIIIDDWSTDNTKEMLWARFRSDRRIRYYKRKNQRGGAAICRNEGIEHSRSSLLIFLDSDDLLIDSALSERIRIMENRPNLDFAVFRCFSFNNKPGDMGMSVAFNTIISEYNLFDNFLAFRPSWQTTGPIWRKEFLYKIGLWNDDLINYDDWELDLRALFSNPRFELLSTVDYYYRTHHDDSLSGNISRLPDHLKNREMLFSSIFQSILQLGIMSRLRRKLLARAFVGIVVDWIVCNKGFNESIKVAERCFCNGIFSINVYFRVLIYIRGSAVLRHHSRLRLVFERFILYGLVPTI